MASSERLQSLVDEYRDQFESSTMFDIPLTELDTDELMAIILFQQVRIDRQQGQIERLIDDNYRTGMFAHDMMKELVERM